ncbi:RNA polymerase sigma factor [Muricauda sp. CAU 1633]|uniref:RNA polymerase sigma factor n=1 Tax=Allomuricauda sp. CAU 1633 TaxID=2816036 RepID=UPI001A8C1FBD|nr:RNA polymerase sigma factor [Muricauda sp. CAU 1633]MBO0324231.1 RNA polymerase sigma factor [Muricauda sp. CAU 1633]
MEQTVDQPNIEAIIGGDSQEFAKLVDKYKVLVFTIAMRMLKNREEAEEVAQDSFLKIYKSLKKFKGDAKLSTWIYRIAYNTCLDRIKKNKKELNNRSIDEVSGYQVAELGNALEEMLQKEKSALIKNSIQSLSPTDAAILTLYYFEENNLNELAKTLKISPNTAKIKLYRARLRLAEVLKKQMEPNKIESYE